MCFFAILLFRFRRYWGPVDGWPHWEQGFGSVCPILFLRVPPALGILNAKSVSARPSLSAMGKVEVLFGDSLYSMRGVTRDEAVLIEEETRKECHIL